MPSETDVRATALGVVWRDRDDHGAHGNEDTKELLVAELGPFEWDDEVFYRPPGGGVQFGESSENAVVREFHEELDADVFVESFAGVVENRFEYGGERNHEIVFVYELAFADDARYDVASMRGVEDDIDVTYETEWATLDDLEARDEALYPEGLRTILETDRMRVAPSDD